MKAIVAYTAFCFILFLLSVAFISYARETKDCAAYQPAIENYDVGGSDGNE